MNGAVPLVVKTKRAQRAAKWSLRSNPHHSRIEVCDGLFPTYRNGSAVIV